jgi:hypothetical protein
MRLRPTGHKSKGKAEKPAAYRQRLSVGMLNCVPYTVEVSRLVDKCYVLLRMIKNVTLIGFYVQNK